MIPCCVVDDHCDIVPFLHCFYRARKVPFDTPVYLFHIDAHPDFSIPSSPKYEKIEEWSNPDLLYDILSEDGGISEFIIPLVTERLITQVIWVKPPWSLQFPLGLSQFQIKNCSQSLPKVNLDIPYYLDDDSFSKFDKSGETIDLSILTCDTKTQFVFDPKIQAFTSKEQMNQETNFPVETAEWILDLCLDYFSTNNPFLEELRCRYALCSPKLISWQMFLEILLEIFENFQYRILPVNNSNRKLISKKDQLDIFASLLRNPLDGQTFVDFANLFSHLQNFGSRLESFLRQTEFLDIETKEFILSTAHLFLLPHHPVPSPEIQMAAIESLRSLILDFMASIHRKAKPPLFITISLSTDDGYTNKSESLFLLNQCLCMIDDLFSGPKTCDPSNLQRKRPLDQSNAYRSIEVYDIRDDPITQAYSIKFTTCRKKAYQDNSKI